jgi:inner membrane protein COX18
MSEVKKRQDKALKRIYRKLGLQQWKVYSSLLSFPFWLLAIDGVRRLCGGPRGLIGSLITSSEVDAAAAATDTAVEAATASLQAATGSISDASTLDGAMLSSAVETANPVVLDPSLTYEGCLWFTDLTVPDPYHILPLALSASLLWNLLPKSGNQFSDRVSIALGRRPKSAQARILAGDDKVGLGERAKSTLYLSLVALATLVGPLTLDLPAALHLYWLASSATNALSSKALQHLMPVKTKLGKRCTGIDLPIIRPKRDQKNQIT